MLIHIVYFSGFELVDETGATVVGAGVEGLLLLDGDTVCDKHFHDTTADIICNLLGYERHSTWTSGMKWDIQSELHTDCAIECWESGIDWSYCDYALNDIEDCEHDQDIFITCSNGAGGSGENSNLT